MATQIERREATRGALLEAAVESLAADKRTVDNLVRMLWGAMSDPALGAAFEVYTAARTDAWMQSAIEPVMADHLERLQELSRDLVAQVSAADATMVRRA